jgi:hypothetical protein
MADPLIQSALPIGQSIVAGAVGGFISWLGTLLLERFKAIAAERLERVKAKETLRLEFAKLQAAKLGELWGEFDELENRLAEVAYQAAKLRIDTNIELFLADAEGNESELTANAKVITERLTHHRLEQEYEPKFSVQLMPQVRVLHSRADALLQKIIPTPFWLGDAVSNRLRVRCTEIKSVLSLLAKYGDPRVIPEMLELRLGKRDTLYTLLDSMESPSRDAKAAA